MPSPASPTQLLQIGEVAERAGLSLRTVRHDEEMGLIIPEKRTHGGFRLCTDELRRASRNTRASAGTH